MSRRQHPRLREIEQRVWKDVEADLFKAFDIMQSNTPFETATVQVRDRVACCVGALSYLRRVRAGLEGQP